MKIIAYTYEADVHCPNCARQYFKPGEFIAIGQLDEHCIDSEQLDREGNRVHPVFDTDDVEFTLCCDCGERL